jgi:GcrA cell cycle regulator
MSWTDERVELLAKLWGDGLSASQIASQLGGVTRNAVIGKVHRLKLETRVKTVVGEVVLEETVEIEPRAAAGGAQIVQMHAALRSVPRVAAGGLNTATALKLEELEAEIVEDIVAEAPRPSGEVVPIARNLTLVQLTERTCKWPLGDPLSPDFRFCGNHSDEASPYCQYHARIAFQPSAERRRVR